MSIYYITCYLESEDFNSSPSTFNIYSDSLDCVSADNPLPDAGKENEDWDHVKASRAYLSELPEDTTGVHLEDEGYYTIEQLRELASE